MNKTVLMLLADGVEEIEALATRDTLLRGGIKEVMSSIMGREVIMSQDGLLIKCDEIFTKKLDYPYDAIILPGGGKGTQNLDRFPLMDEVLEYFFTNYRLVSAICAAPMVLGHRGYLKDKKYTCYKGCNEGLDGLYTGKEVEIDQNIITARSMYYANDFALEIIKYLLGEEDRLRVENSIKSK